MDGETTPFLNQIMEVERAVENLARSGKLNFARSSHYGNRQQFPAQPGQGSSRYPHASYYASQRAPVQLVDRDHGAMRRGNQPVPSLHNHTEFRNRYLAHPPPLQQQYAHSQQQTAYAGPSFPAPIRGEEEFLAYERLTGQEQQTKECRQQNDVSSGASDYLQQATRSFSPFGNGHNASYSAQQNSGDASSSQSTTPSLSGGMSASMSMLPPGYGRGDMFASLPSMAHSRAHSIAGSLSGLSSVHTTHGLPHTRTKSISQTGESGRAVSGHVASSGNTTSGMFSPPLPHSRADSFSGGSTGTASPSAAAFNFFTAPQSQSHSTASLQAGSTSGSSHAIGGSRITPIGRPAQGKAIGSEALGASRMASMSSRTTATNSGMSSGVTSPLSSGYGESWLDGAPTHPSDASVSGRTSGNDIQRRSVASVWNN